ncbi:hypothetical protein JH06_2562 [Blastocystis sp. subtype 4]|uniref:hypothetical protein n=1 Tax=Blastocystis sp. subtype 4 TaxID=944170 RepID=UPI000711C1BA|nr:hypothetical protein JH06_2562 [Blastocystis sp. subtype 4]KNB43593.1 hypothetical protein JH06_2562 [Blastocystis sp. subtype 4]|eukprot:XP_014527036.1 hypothetical protein JH06_2562 [Blastocystis sp. subtype 4]
MDDPGEIIDLERQGSKHLSCTQLRQRLEEEMDDETTATANIKRNLDQKVYCSVSSCNQIFAKECSNIRYIIMRKKHESFETQDSFHRFMYLVYTTILGCIFTVVNFIIACTNMAPALGYDKSHLNAIIWVLPISMVVSFLYLAYMVFVCLSFNRSTTYPAMTSILTVVLVFQGASTVYSARVRDMFKPIPDSLRDSVKTILRL